MLPIGSTEQHAHLSLSVDTILSERVAVEAAEPLRIPVFPVIAYGLTPNFVEYPGTVTLRMSTLCALVTDVLDGIVRSGFRRILIVNGHGGNIPVHGAVLEWLGRHHGCQVQVAQLVECAEDLGQGEGDRSGRLARVLAGEFSLDAAAGVTQPATQKPMMDLARFVQLDPVEKKELLGDGNYGGLYQRSDEEMLAMWHVAVEETRALMQDGWA